MLLAAAGTRPAGAAIVGVGAVVGALVAVTTGAGGALVAVGVTGGLVRPAGTVAVGIGTVVVGVAGGPGRPAGAVAVGTGTAAVGVAGGLGRPAGTVGAGVGPAGPELGGAVLVGAGLVGAGLVGAGLVAVGLGDGDWWHPQPGWIIRSLMACCREPAIPAASGTAAAIAVADPVQVTAARPKTARAPPHEPGRPVPVLAPAGESARGVCTVRTVGTVPPVCTACTVRSACPSGAPRAVPPQAMTSAPAIPAAAAAGRTQAPRSRRNSSGSRPDAIPRAAR